LKVAVTDCAAVIETVQVPVPVQAPLQPANVEPLAAEAVSVTEVPLAKLALHVLPQLMPDGEEVTVPVPVPARVTVRVWVVALVLKVAVTDRAAVIETVQVPVPVQAPLQPANVEPLAAEAVSVTEVPLAKLALHVLPQLIPVGDELTVPVPVPARVTVRVWVVALVLKVAVTDFAAVIGTVQVPVPVQAPLQPANVEPLAAEAVRVTEAPLAKLALHVLPQLMPAGDEVTVPLPVPARVTVSANVPPVPGTNGDM
jgi:hypothetical protein